MGELAFGEGSQIDAVAFSPDSKTLAVFEAREGVSLWNTLSVQRTAKISNEVDGPRAWGDIGFSPDGQALAIGDSHGRVRLVKVGDLRPQFAFNVRTNMGVIALAFSRDGKWLASGSGDQAIKLWDTASWKEIATLVGHTDEIWSLSFSRDSRRLVSAGKDGAVYVWPVQAVHAAHTIMGLPPDLNLVDVAPDGKTLAAIRRSGELMLWDVSPAQPQKRSPQFGTNNIALSYAPTGELLIGARSPAEIKIFNPKDGSLLEYPLNGTGQPDQFWFLPESRTVLSARVDRTLADGALQRWDWATHCELPSISAGRPFVGAIDFGRIAFCLDAPLLCAEVGSTLTVRNYATGRDVQLFPFKTYSGAKGLCFVPKLNLVAAASPDASVVHVWDLTNGLEIATLEGHNAVLSKLTASPDGTRLLTATIGHEPAKLWDTRSWEEVAHLECPGAGFHEGNFLPDGNTLFVLDSTRKLHLWRAPSWEQINAAEAMDKAEPRAPK